MTELVEIVPRPDPGARWQPVVGDETHAFLRSLRLPPADTEGRDRLLNEAWRVVARCAPPTANERETGLVIGYVQSGKTTSFTTVAALARDNGFRLLIVCTGLTVSLFKQSAERLKRDLRLDDRPDRSWVLMENPRATPESQQMIATALDAERTVLITVMKNGRHLDNLGSLLAQLPLEACAALIIDDEADQASLNNDIRRAAESATYRRILRLRDLVPRHTFLQYTATPQALLLINLIDTLSPAFAQVLSPGTTYTGGRVFFEQNMELVREIPPSDIPSLTNVLSGAPLSLREALRVFWIGVAVGLTQTDGGVGNRSMMVHPSAQTRPHADYHQWVRSVQGLWAGVLEGPESDPDRQTLIESFRQAHADLAETVEDLPEFDAIAPQLRNAIKQTIVSQVNAARGRTPPIDWHQFYSHIVVGGEVLNRGLTVQGLTVTYMVRGPGTGQADTIQQRARWFGYKADYLGYCRVYLTSQMRSLYAAYVDHESHLREQVEQHSQTGEDLRRWRRAFFLDPQLRPTRDQVIDLQPLRGVFSDDWFEPVAPQDSLEAVEANQQVVSNFISNLGERFQEDDGDPRRTAPQIHLVASGVSLQAAYQEFLTQVWFGNPRDSTRFAGLLLQVGRFLEGEPDAVCTVYQMSQGHLRERSLTAGEIPQLFQGANYDESVRPRQTVYPGDREIRVNGQLTIQIHNLEVKDGATVVATGVPAIAVWVPQAMAAAWVVQAQQ